MYKVGIVGDKDSILAFQAIGVDTYPVYNPREARATIDKMAEEGFGLIFVTEQVAKDILDTIQRYKNKMVPTIILVPNNQGTHGIGMQDINDNVEKAVGSNIFNQ